jgi:hypothetical protein
VNKKKTIYDTGDDVDIRLFELMKAHPEVQSLKVRRMKNGLIKTESVRDKEMESKS